MTEAAPQQVLKRMAEAGRAAIVGPPPTPARNFGQAVAKAAQSLLKLPVAVGDASEQRAVLADLPERLPERALIAVMEGPREAMGLMVLSQETLACLIEIQTTGRLAAGAAQLRRPTRTDAAMSQRFANRVIEELELLLAHDPAITWAGGFRYASVLEDTRLLGLLFEDTGYRLLALDLAFGADGARRGQLIYVVPAEGRGAAPAPLAALGAPAGDAGWGERLEVAVSGAEVRLEAVLARIELPLAAVLSLTTGEMIALPSASVGRLRLEGHGGRLVLEGRLGQCQGQVAVRLDRLPPEEAEIIASFAEPPLPAAPGPAKPAATKPVPMAPAAAPALTSLTAARGTAA